MCVWGGGGGGGGVCAETKTARMEGKTARMEGKTARMEGGGGEEGVISLGK